MNVLNTGSIFCRTLYQLLELYFIRNSRCMELYINVIIEHKNNTSLKKSVKGTRWPVVDSFIITVIKIVIILYICDSILIDVDVYLLKVFRILKMFKRSDIMIAIQEHSMMELQSYGNFNLYTANPCLLQRALACIISCIHFYTFSGVCRLITI